MAAAVSLKNRNVAILQVTKFGTVTQFDPHARPNCYFFEILKIKMAAAAILTKNRKIACFTDRHYHTLSILPDKTGNIIKQNWNQFLLVVKANAVKQQMPIFYPQILSTEASFYSLRQACDWHKCDR